MKSTASTLIAAPAMTMLPAEDLGRARGFYESTLGLPVQQSGDDESTLIVEAGGDTRIGLYEHARTKADHTAVTFEVADLDAAMSDLRAHGVHFEDYDYPGLKTVDGVAARGRERAAWFFDSEGNTLCLHQAA